MNNKLIRMVTILATTIVMLVLQFPAQAGSFSVTPVRIYITPKDRAVAITLSNEGDTKLLLQADIYSWSQKPDGTDELKLTEDLLLSPPIIKLAPKARQVVRLAVLTSRDTTRQMTYRMIVREVPETVHPHDINMPITLALNMPVFVTPPVASREINCTVGKDGANTLQAICSNSGTAYAQVREIALNNGNNKLASFEGGNYILPGAQKTIELKSNGNVASGTAQMTVTFDDFKTQTFNVSIP